MQQLRQNQKTGVPWIIFARSLRINKSSSKSSNKKTQIKKEKIICGAIADNGKDSISIKNKVQAKVIDANDCETCQ